ncbi:hypothetical protein ACHAXS_000860 [Conticribra weissflogii]
MILVRYSFTNSHAPFYFGKKQHVKTRGYSNLRLDGTVPTSSRQPLVDKFQNDDSIFMFLISTKAGGLGLNLTAANKVIIFDVNWNPSYDEQAQDRSFRIGQKKNVEVVRLVSRGTIEELVYCRQVYKVQLKKQTFGSLMNDENQPQIFRGVSQDQNRKGELFGVENLLSFKDGSFMDKIVSFVKRVLCLLCRKSCLQIVYIIIPNVVENVRQYERSL